MEHVLLIWASPNRDGLTSAAKNAVLRGLAAGGARADEVWLNHCAMQRCLACGDGWGLCRAEGRCVLKDDFAALYERLRAAQGLVLVTPVYWHDMAEGLKAFLDRLRRCETAHSHALRGMQCLLVACAGGSGLGAVPCLARMEETLGHMKMEAAERVPVTQFNRGYMLPALEGAGRAFAAWPQTPQE